MKSESARVESHEPLAVILAARVWTQDLAI
jgi:hypothetical protein